MLMFGSHLGKGRFSPKDARRPVDKEARSVQLWKERYEDNVDRDANGMVTWSPNSRGPWNVRFNDMMFWI